MKANELSSLAEDRVAIMEGLIVEHPRLVQVHQKMDTLVSHGRRNPKEKQCMALIADSGTGKTVMINTFVAKMNTPDARARGDIPALHVTLKAKITPKGFVQDVLFKIAEMNGVETAPHIGNENVLLERACKLMRAAHVEILIIDEFHHLVLTDNEKIAYTVGETMKWMLQAGVCPMVMCGTEKARKPFRANPQLVRRAIPPVPLEPLRSSRKEDRDLFGEFLAKYLVAMGKLGVCQNSRALFYGDIPSCLLEASGGILGLSCKLLIEAIRLMTFEGRDELSRDDLTRANDLLLLSGVCQTNPFRDGLKGMPVAA